MKEKKSWQLQNKEPAIDLGILNINYHFYKNPRNGKVVKTFSMNAQDAANAIPLTKDRKVIMVKQFRFGIGDYTLEIPGGMLEEGEEMLEGIKREVREETGYVGKDWQLLGKIQSNPVFMDSYVYHFLVRDVVKRFDLELDEAEEVELVEIPVDKVYQLIRDGVIQHPHTITAFHYAQPLLFG